MVNSNAGRTGKGNNNGDKGKGKLVYSRGISKDTPFLPSSTDLKKYDELLAESVQKTVMEIKTCKQGSKQPADVKEEAEESSEYPEWDEPLALQLEELILHHLKDSYQTAINKIAASGYSMEQAEWGVLTSSFYIGSKDITSNIIEAAMAVLNKRKDFDPSERYIFQSVESLANYTLVEMVNVLKQVKPYMTVADAMWQLLLCDLNLLKAREWEEQPLQHFGNLESSFCKEKTFVATTKASLEYMLKDLQRKGISAKTKSYRGETVYALPTMITAVTVPPRKGKMQATGKMAAGSPAVTNKTEKDEAIEMLMQRKEQMEKEMQGWNDWTTVRIRQAAQKLSKDQAEMKVLRLQPIQEPDKSQKGKAAVDENSAKQFSELENALYNVEALKGMADSSIRKLKEERIVLVKELKDTKLIAANSSQNLQEAKVREQELLKQCRSLEAEVSFLQEDLAAMRSKGGNLQLQIGKARRRENEFEVLRQHEEREKTKFLQKAESLRAERKQMNDQAKAEEEKLKAKAEEKRLKFEERMRKISAEISALKLTAASGESSGQGGLKRERECIMCLTRENVIVFLPCAHQVLCQDCNLLHSSQGMMDCPTCRTPITKRITARFPPPKPR